ncbi:MAG: DNA polymerase IV [Pseudomonadota bacterium]
MAETAPQKTPKASGNVAKGDALCRDCGAAAEANAARCGVCGGPRLLAHPELHALTIAHVDCDAFYASIEKRDDPSLRDRPVIVGGGRRGVVSAACYIARSYGVRSAMPMFKSLPRCPDAAVIRPNMAKYVAAAHEIRALMDAVTPLVQPISIDEAFLDLAGLERLHGMSPAARLVQLALEVEREVGVTVSIGLSHNKFLAKVASDLKKPRGFAVIGEAETFDFLSDKPIGLIWGVGKKMQARLAADGLKTIGDLQRAEPSALAKRYGTLGARLAELARGEDSRPVRVREEAKSISSETTFNDDLSDLAPLAARLSKLCERVSARAKAKDMAGRVVTLKLKTAGFKTLTRRATLAAPTALAGRLFETSRALLEKEVGGGPFRLIGVGLSDFKGAPAEANAPDDLFAEDQGPDPLERLESALDTVRARFGDEAIIAGRSIDTARQDLPGRGRELGKNRRRPGTR